MVNNTQNIGNQAVRSNSNGQIEKLTLLCNLNVNTKKSYSTKQINQIIDFCLDGFKVAKNEIKLTIDERLMLFVDVRNYSIGK